MGDVGILPCPLWPSFYSCPHEPRLDILQVSLACVRVMTSAFHVIVVPNREGDSRLHERSCARVISTALGCNVFGVLPSGL